MNAPHVNADSKSPLRTLLSLLIAVSLVLCALPMVGCGKQEEPVEEEEQDNCYGDDLPVMNE